ncbi:MAG: YceI family protein [bacterium]
MRMISTAAIVGVAALMLAATGCKNPAEGKAKAAVSEARPTPSGPLQGATERAVLSPANTKLEWKGSKVTGSHTGGFAKFSGSIEGTGADPTKALLTIDIDLTSLTSDTPKLTGHLKSKDFFNVAEHPKGRFVSTSIKTGGQKGASHTITGNLTLRGVTKSIAFPATLQITDTDVHAASEFWIDRTLWGISFPGMKDNLIRKEVVIKLDVKVKRQKQ